MNEYLRFDGKILCGSKGYFVRTCYWLNSIQCRSLYPIVEYSVLGHAVGSTELLHSASIVAVQHLLANAGTVAAGTPGMVTRSHVSFEDLLTV